MTPKSPSKAKRQDPPPEARGLVDDNITVAVNHIAVYNNMEVPDAKTVEVVGLLLDPGWS
jgi:hypothetical protein